MKTSSRAKSPKLAKSPKDVDRSKSPKLTEDEVRQHGAIDGLHMAKALVAEHFPGHEKRIGLITRVHDLIEFEEDGSAPESLAVLSEEIEACKAQARTLGELDIVEPSPEDVLEVYKRVFLLDDDDFDDDDDYDDEDDDEE